MGVSLESSHSMPYASSLAILLSRVVEEILSDKGSATNIAARIVALIPPLIAPGIIPRNLFALSRWVSSEVARNRLLVINDKTNLASNMVAKKATGEVQT